MLGLSRFVTLCRNISLAMTPAHIKYTRAEHYYRARVIETFIRNPGAKVADVAAGKRWPFDSGMKHLTGIHLTGLDISREEMAPNTDLDDDFECDVCQHIPYTDRPYDIITCRSGVEHFYNNENFLINCYHALKPGGRVILCFPNKYAIFAITNRLLPQRLSSYLLRRLTPGGAEGVTGFRAFYDRTSYRAFSGLARDTGFIVEDVYPGYFSMHYFAAIPPVYLLLYMYDVIQFSMGIKTTASNFCFILQKPDEDMSDHDTRLHTPNKGE